jgi:hypothetical protein
VHPEELCSVVARQSHIELRRTHPEDLQHEQDGR